MQAHRYAVQGLLVGVFRRLEMETDSRRGKRAPMGRKKMFELDVTGGSRWQGILKGY
jgi:hypothetical protein